MLGGLVPLLEAGPPSQSALTRRVAFAQRWVEMNPPEEKAQALEVVALGLLELGRLGEAEEAAQEGIRLAPSHKERAVLLTVLAGVKRDEGKLQEALECARRGATEMALARGQGGAGEHSAVPFAMEADILNRMRMLEEARAVDRRLTEELGITPGMGADLRHAMALVGDGGDQGAEARLGGLCSVSLDHGDAVLADCLNSVEGHHIFVRAGGACA